MSVYHNYLLVCGHIVNDRKSTILSFGNMTEDQAVAEYRRLLVEQFPNVTARDIILDSVYASEAPIELLYKWLI